MYSVSLEIRIFITKTWSFLRHHWITVVQIERIFNFLIFSCFSRQRRSFLMAQFDRAFNSTSNDVVRLLDASHFGRENLKFSSTLWFTLVEIQRIFNFFIFFLFFSAQALFSNGTVRAFNSTSNEVEIRIFNENLKFSSTLWFTVVEIQRIFNFFIFSCFSRQRRSFLMAQFDRAFNSTSNDVLGFSWNSHFHNENLKFSSTPLNHGGANWKNF